MTEAIDTGLDAFVTLLRLRGISVDGPQLRHQFGMPLHAEQMLRAARQFGVKARLVTTRRKRLQATPLPAVAALKDGRYLLLGNVSGNQAIVQLSGGEPPRSISVEEFETIWDGRLLMVTRRASLTDPNRRFDIGWFLGAIRKYRGLLGEVVLGSFFLQILGLISPLIFQIVIDKVLVHRSLSTLDVLVAAFTCLAVAETLLGALRTYLFSHTTNRIDVELGARLFRHLMALPVGYFSVRRVGDSVARVRELENIRNFLTSSALTLAIDLFFIFVFLAVMLLYSWQLTAVVLCSLPLYIGISAFAAPLFRRRLDEKFRRGAENQAFLVESVTGVETLKAMAIEPQMQRRWEEQLAAYVSASFEVLKIGNVASQLVQLVSKLVTGLTLYLGAKLVIDGTLSVGELVAFNMLAGRVSAPVLRLAQLWQDFHQARISMDRLGDILNTPAEPTFSAAHPALPPIRGAIKFEHVGFRYSIDGAQILDDVSFDVPEGQIVGVVGASGSGKSTLAKLVQRLYVPERGRVLIDGIDISLADAAWLRRQLGVVLQENVLFSGTIRENIALADPAIPMARVIAAARMAGAHEFILDLPGGYDAVVGERGASLSGGQRQRIAIARALLGDPRILIFDEATSALDYESERVIQKNMADIARGRTVIIIAHRLSTVRFADRILTIDRGRLVEDGRHDDLVGAGGRYANLYRLQAGIHEVR